MSGMDVGVIIKDQYQVVERIGRGGMADVWSARDKRLRRLVAIKTIAHGLSQDVDPVKLFEQEAQTIAQMEHPHILPIYDFGEYDQSLYIVMRYVAGGSLEDSLSGGPLSIEETLRMGQAIAQALDYAHDKNVIHLDLKPPNILLDSSGAPYLADFGLATVLDPEGRARNPGSGTLLYMAPEQLVADLIDHRADIYSFCIMLFHMMTGQLPFEGASPLAIRQLQYQEELPDLADYLMDVPDTLTALLRRGTAQQPERRPKTHMEIIEQMQELLASSSIGLTSPSIDDSSEYNIDTEIARASDNPALLEAVDIYTRARHAWAGGQGRFLLGVTHFMLMSEIYQGAQDYGLTIDRMGHQMLLRGALEYDYEVDYWWSTLDDDDRRWVSLHALRSGTAPTRIRALYRLETLPDHAEVPLIPKLVSQALEVEDDPTAKLAALRVLRARHHLTKEAAQYEIKTEYRGRLLTSMTRLGITLAPPMEWREAVYSPEVDLLIADSALDTQHPEIAEYAARTIGQMRSLTAVRRLAKWQKEKTPGALEALAFVRDETTELPGVVDRQARLYAWITNTIRRVTDNPFEGLQRYIWVLIFAWIATGQFFFVTFRNQALFTPQRWANTLATGLIMALMMSIIVMLADEIPRRLNRFWPWWGRVLLGGITAFGAGILFWGLYRGLYLGGTDLHWPVVRMGAFGVMIGLLVTAMLDWRGWRAIPIVTASFFIPMLAAYHNWCHLVWVCYTASGELYPPFTPTWAFGLGGLFGAFIGWHLPRSQAARDLTDGLPPWLRIVVASILGMVWAAAGWLALTLLFAQQFIDWDHITLMFLVSMVFGVGLVYILSRRERLALILTGAAAYGGMFYFLQPFFLSHSVVPQETGYAVIDSLFELDYPEQLLTLLLPIAFVMALGAHMPTLINNWWAIVGKPRVPKERGGWLAGVLGYVILAGTFVAVLSIFTLTRDVTWAIVTTSSAFIVTIFGVATWRWAKWGARGLLLLALPVIGLGFLMDAMFTFSYVDAGRMPLLFLSDSLFANLIMACFLYIAAWGARKQHLWGGIGLVGWIVMWFMVALFTPAFMSVALLLSAHVALVAYALRPHWSYMEADRFSWQTIRSLVWPVRPAKPKKTESPAVTSPSRPITHSTRPSKANTVLSLSLATSGTDDAARMNANDTDTAAMRADDMATKAPIAYDGQSAMDVAAQFDAGNLQTELDRNVHPGIRIDTGRLRSDVVPDLPTEFDVAADYQAGQQKPDIHHVDTEPAEQSYPSIKIDTGRLRSDVVPDLPTEFDVAADYQAGQKPEADEKPKPSIKIDTGRLRSDVVPDLPTEFDVAADYQANQANHQEDNDDEQTQYPSIKIDTGYLRSDVVSDLPTEFDVAADYQAGQQPPADEKPKPSIKIDTGRLRSDVVPDLPTEFDVAAQYRKGPDVELDTAQYDVIDDYDTDDDVTYPSIDFDTGHIHTDVLLPEDEAFDPVQGVDDEEDVTYPSLDIGLDTDTLSSRPDGGKRDDKDNDENDD